MRLNFDPDVKEPGRSGQLRGGEHSGLLMDHLALAGRAGQGHEGAHGRYVDFMDKEGRSGRSTTLSLVSETEFDQIFARVKERGLTHWADPARAKAGNRHDSGRGVYFEDPSGHLLEIITRPYGSSGWEP
jgi:catechol 2,3-dioxygenase-like lactoylglutathione lyase family enzyme